MIEGAADTVTTHLDPIESETLTTRHAFFTRVGGVSSGLYDSLQCGFGADDRTEAVREKRARAARWLGVSPAALRTLHQVHSADVWTLRAGEPDTSYDPTDAPKADALATDRDDIALGVLSADCAPLLLEDASAGVIGAAHAGWRGALSGVLEATVQAMASLGARPGRIRLAIGPTIGPAAYQVGPEYVARFVADDGDNRRFFSAADADGRALFDLPAYLIARAAHAGLADAVWTGVCTVADAARCFSHRRAVRHGEPDYGRLLSAIRLGERP